jgi:hypothetical protein
MSCGDTLLVEGQSACPLLGRRWALEPDHALLLGIVQSRHRVVAFPYGPARALMTALKLCYLSIQMPELDVVAVNKLFGVLLGRFIVRTPKLQPISYVPVRAHDEGDILAWARGVPARSHITD